MFDVNIVALLTNAAFVVLQSGFMEIILIDLELENRLVIIMVMMMVKMMVMMIMMMVMMVYWLLTSFREQIICIPLVLMSGTPVVFHSRIPMEHTVHGQQQTNHCTCTV